MNWFDQRDVLSAGVIGFEFEFFSNLTRKDVADQISRLCNKKVFAVNRYHSRLRVTANTWKVEPDFSGGMKMHELITGPMTYDEARVQLFKILEWIDKFGWTTDKCAFQFNLSFNHWKLKLNNQINQMDKLKFILSFDEDKVLEAFPERKQSIYVQSIMKIFPVNRFQFVADVDRVIPENYIIPVDKYYGVNFKKSINQDYIEFRYLGGTDYQKKAAQISNVIDYCVLQTVEVLQNPTYTIKDLEKLNLHLKKIKNLSNSFSDYEHFRLNYPEVVLSVDLKHFEQNIKTFWNTIREKLFDLIVFCQLKTGWINYDTDLGRFQLKDATLPNCYLLNNFEIVDCELSGVIKNCDLYHCTITNSHIIECKIIVENKIVGSKISSSPIYFKNEIENTYIDNKMYHIDGSIKKCIVRSGIILSTAVVQATENISGIVAGSKDKDSMDSFNYTKVGDKDKDSPFMPYPDPLLIYDEKDKDASKGYRPDIDLGMIGDKDKDSNLGYRPDVNLDTISDKDKDANPGYNVGITSENKQIVPKKVSKFRDLNWEK